MGEHSVVGASSMYRWANCTSSPSLIMTLEPELQNNSSIYADEGSAAHRLCDLGVQEIKYLLHKKKDIRQVLEADLIGTHIARYKYSDDWEVIGTNPFNGDTMADKAEMLVDWTDNHFKCDEEMQEGVRFYLEYVIEAIESCEGEVHVEPETRCYPMHERDDVFGTSDCVIIDLDGQRVWVVDFKFGRRLVTAQDNLQALFYAAGAIQAHRSNLNADAKVTLTIIQPRVEFADGRRISDAEYTVRDVVEWIHGTLEPAVTATRSPALAEYKAGDYCEYCAAYAICPLMQDQALKKVREAFGGDIETVSMEDVPEIELILPDREDPDQLGLALRIGAILAKWNDKVKELAEHYAVQGKALPGFKVVRATTQRRWTDEESVLERLRERGTYDQGVKVKPKTPAQMEASEALTEEDLAELVVKPEGALTLAPLSDRRSPVKTVAQQFSDADS